MNQDNYLAEAVKMRNLINEFNPPIYNDMTAAAGGLLGWPASWPRRREHCTRRLKSTVRSSLVRSAV